MTLLTTQRNEGRLKRFQLTYFSLQHVSCNLAFPRNPTGFGFACVCCLLIFCVLQIE